MKTYLNMLQYILDNGTYRADRTGTGTVSVFGYQASYSLDGQFPLLTTKKMFMRGIIHELLWFLKGDTNVKYLIDHNVHIWTPDAYRWYKQKAKDYGEPILSYEEYIEKIKTDQSFANVYGDLGPIYGKQWRAWTTNQIEHKDEYPAHVTIDQIQKVIHDIKHNQTSRRLIVSGWNVADLDQMALPPCHTLFQFYVDGEYLSCQLYQRSCDAFLGAPFNIASYALLTAMIAHVTGLKPKAFIHTIGDLHIYTNHLDAVKEQLQREPFALPKLWLNPHVKDINDFTYDDIKVLDYTSHPPIKAPISVGE